MGRFWKHKSDKPLVWGHSGWYYSIEYYGISYTFIDIEQFRERGKEIAERREKWGRSCHPIWSKFTIAVRRHQIRERIIHFRHRDEVVDLYERAYKQFYSECHNEE